MATISNVPRPGYVWDSTDNVWYPIGVGAHQHTNAADTPAVMPYSTYAAAGKNKILNGDFSINQRGFTSLTSTGGYTFDRWQYQPSGATTTCSAETFTPGAAPVSGYEARNFIRLTTTTGNDFCRLDQLVEDVRTLAGQTVTISFWAKGTNPSTAGNLKLIVIQNFGSGGSADVSEQKTFTITSNWARYSINYTLGSMSGKTIGTNSFLAIRFGQGDSTSTDSWTLDLWGVQLEAGSTVTAFQTATGNPASELAACQRYYWRSTPQTTFGMYGLGVAGSTTQALVSLKLPVTMRVIPTSIDVPTTITSLKLTNYTATNWTISAVALLDSTFDNLLLGVTSSGMTANQALIFGNNNNAAGFIGASAEL